VRIILDLQSAQTSDCFSGIGRYSLTLAKGIARNRGEHEVFLALNGMLSHGIEYVRAEFDGLLPQTNILVWHAPGPVREIDPGNTPRRQGAELLRESFLASLEPDIVHLGSLFAGYLDNAVTSVGCLHSTFPTAVTLYSVPASFDPKEDFKSDPMYVDYYRRKLTHLTRTALLLTVSDSYRRDVIDALSVIDRTVVNISSAADACINPADLTKDQCAQILGFLGIYKPFVLLAGERNEKEGSHYKIRSFAKLPRALRAQHQLVITGVLAESEREALRQTAKSAGLDDNGLRIVGHVSDAEMPALVRTCRLFVLSSSQECLERSAMEAMAHGAAVIAANTPKFSKLIGRDDALFNSDDEQSMTSKMDHILTDEVFLKSLQEHGKLQAGKFSSDLRAKRAIAAFEELYEQRKHRNLVPMSDGSLRRLKLACITPVPPERTGIADYSAELIPELAKYYDIEIVTPQREIDPRVRVNCPVRTVEWFRQNAGRYDRLLYHFGNSHFHSHMFDLLLEHPGVIVLHDFFLGDVYWHDETSQIRPLSWARELLHAHGYFAVQERFFANNSSDVVWKYPCSLTVLQKAIGVIVHSNTSRELAKQWYGDGFGDDWAPVPLLRKPPTLIDTAFARSTARNELGIPDDALLVCSFGHLGPTKLSHRLLAAWLHSRLATDPRCLLVFVGGNHPGEYGATLWATILEAGLTSRVRITGWASESLYRQYLRAADIGVQLRTWNRGETSAAVLDCMNYGVATIVNAHGSMSELPQESVWMIPNLFTDEQLILALDTLSRDVNRRLGLAAYGKATICEQHVPSECAKRSADAVERHYGKNFDGQNALIGALANLDAGPHDETVWRELTICALGNRRRPDPGRALLVDVTATISNDLKTGIERVARAICLQWLQSEIPRIRIEPVYLSHEGGQWHYRYARKFALGLLGCRQEIFDDAPAQFKAGDILMALDISGAALLSASRSGLFSALRTSGVRIHFMVYDLSPILFPQFFPPGADRHFSDWLSILTRYADGIVTISRKVAVDLLAYAKKQCPPRYAPLKISWSHIGADISGSAPTAGLDEDALQIISKLSEKSSFLMVGTIEPRKGHLQTLAAFEQLWASGADVNLVIVGKEGWTHLPN
jgi:glycosyltransferase involved in cell wall biosynthesis